MKVLEEKDYIAYCDVCGAGYKNWSGSTPCCGALAWIPNEIHYRKRKLNQIIDNIKNTTE